MIFFSPVRDRRSVRGGNTRNVGKDKKGPTIVKLQTELLELAVLTTAVETFTDLI